MIERKVPRFIFGFLLGANVLVWAIVFWVSQSRPLKVVFFDVGQGDAIFIETPQLHQILIDGGPGSKILEKLSREMPFYDRSLDLVVLTHPEKDHMGGLIEVLKKYDVDYILWTGILRNTAEFREWQNSLQKEKAKIEIARAGQRVVASETRLDILHPFESLEGKEFKDSNDTSVVARLSFGKNSFLFTGDIYQSEERKLAERRSDLNSDVLKVAHHGSKTSTSEGFIEKVLPEIAIVQVGENNPYGHPHKEVLERLKKHDVLLLRTDEKGDIKIVSDGKYLDLKTEK